MTSNATGAPARPSIFTCRVCGSPTDIAPDPPEKAICESCCHESEEGHDFYYESMMLQHVCKHCGAPRPEGL